MKFSMKVTIRIEPDSPDESRAAAKLQRRWNRAIADQVREMQAPATLDDSLARDLGEAVARTLQDFVQLKRRARARVADSQ